MAKAPNTLYSQLHSTQVGLLGIASLQCQGPFYSSFFAPESCDCISVALPSNIPFEKFGNYRDKEFCVPVITINAF